MGRHPRRPAEALVYDPERYRPRPPTQLVYLYISDEAYAYLVERAITLHYVRSVSVKAKGLTAYLASLVLQDQVWTDARPEYLRALSDKLLDSTYDNQRRTQVEGSVTSLFNPELPLAPADRPPPGPRHAIWWDPDLAAKRLRRAFVVHQFPLAYYGGLALNWGIGSPNRREFDTRPAVLASNALEAIGRKTLIPAIEHVNPAPPKASVRRWRPKEIDW